MLMPKPHPNTTLELQATLSMVLVELRMLRAALEAHGVELPKQAPLEVVHSHQVLPITEIKAIEMVMGKAAKAAQRRSSKCQGDE
jgi:hypothetical protein